MGFSLVRKEWCRFYIDTISECEWKDEDYCWEALILGNKEELVLRSLVQNHESGPDTARDQIAQKRNGLVVLLHGTPGSGKTLTAETAAEGSRKVLLSTSFDPAMKSRMHFALSCSAPDAKLRTKIRNNYLGVVRREGGINIALSEEGLLEELAKDGINGREISNTINTTKTIARAQGRKLTLEHIHTVLDTRRSFDLASEK